MSGEFAFGEGLPASLTAAGISSLGILSIAFLGDWGRRNSSYFSAFAVGVLFVATTFHLIPEAMSHAGFAWRWVLYGLFGMSFVGLVLRQIANARGDAHSLAFGYASLIALGFHSFLDGLIYESAFHLQDFSGWLSALGLLLHEFPEGAIAYYLARDAGLGPLASGLWAFGVASATTVVGAVAAAAMIERVALIPFAELLGLTAGALLYVVIFHLGPHARFTPRRRGYAFAAFGVIVATAAIMLRHA